MYKHKDKEITKKTYELIAEIYEQNHKLTSENLISLNRFLSYVGSGRALDVGCADGLESDYLLRNKLRVIGIDLSPTFVEKARKNYPLCEFKVMDMEDLTFPNSSFKGIWASASFIHIPKERASDVLKGFNRVLEKNGTLFISTKFGKYNRLWKNKYMKWVERHFSHYTKKELIKLIEGSGFEVLEINRNYVSLGNSWLHLFARKI